MARKDDVVSNYFKANVSEKLLELDIDDIYDEDENFGEKNEDEDEEVKREY